MPGNAGDRQGDAFRTVGVGRRDRRDGAGQRDAPGQRHRRPLRRLQGLHAERDRVNTPRTSTSSGSEVAPETLVSAAAVSTDTAETESGMSTLLFGGGVIVSGSDELKPVIVTAPAVTACTTPL